MRFKIRTKLITAFLAIIFPFIILVGVITIYKQNTIIMGIVTISDMIEEREAVAKLQIAFDRVIMPGNDYIITAGDKRYIDDFQKGSENVERLLESADAILRKMEGELLYQTKEKREMLKDANISWRNIKEISLKIFEITNPTDNKDAARLVEEMDYKWAYPAIERLNKWNEISYEEFWGAVMGMGREWRRAWIIMIAGAGILIISGVFFAIFYSRLFTRPIEAIHNDAGAIAGGDFKTRIDVKTGDEIEELGNAMNEMAAQLDNFHSNLQGMVDGRTRELKESEERLQTITESAGDAIISMKSPDTIYMWNKKAEEIFGYPADEAIGRDLHKLIVSDVYREKADKGRQEFFKTGRGAILGKALEFNAVRKDGAEFPVELSVSAMKIKGEWHATGIIRDITERKEAEKRLAEQMDFLERFHKAAAQREFRIKELKDRVKELEEELKVRKL